jgi:hypothetical protein
MDSTGVDWLALCNGESLLLNKRLSSFLQNGLTGGRDKPSINFKPLPLEKQLYNVFNYGKYLTMVSKPDDYFIV